MSLDKVLSGDLVADYRELLVDALERARAKLEYSAIGASFCGELFTIGDLRRVYVAVWGVELDPANFCSQGAVSRWASWSRQARLCRRGPGDRRASTDSAPPETFIRLSHADPEIGRMHQRQHATWTYPQTTNPEEDR